MASIFLKDPVYITTREVIDSTTKTAMIPFVNVTGEALQTDAIIWDKLFLAQKNFDDIVVENIVIKTEWTELVLDTDYSVFLDDGTLWKDWYTYIEILTIQTWDITADYKCIPSDDSLKILIYKAEKEIDAYLWSTYRPVYDETQLFLFPVLKEDVSYLPDDIKEATLYTVEQVYVSGDTVTASIGGGSVIEEKTGPHTIKYAEWVNVTLNIIPNIAKKILDEYKLIYFWQII